MPIQDRMLDFEDFSSDTEKLSAILKRCEVSSQKHRLCYEYYRARKFALLHPSVISCVAIGVLGFTVTTEAIKRHMKVGSVQVEDVLTLIVGFLGFFVGMNMLLMNQWDFGSRESMHLSALIELEKLGDKVRFWKMDRKVGTGHDVDASDTDRQKEKEKGRKELDTFGESERKALGVVEAPRSHKVALVVASGRVLRKVEGEIRQKTVAAQKTEDKRSDVSRFSGYNGAYHQINSSCKSDVPSQLSRPFDLFESRLECMSLGHLGVIWDTRMRRNQIMRLAAVEIYNEITGYWLWPFGTPDIDDVIDRSMKRVARLISKDYRAPIKVECCGFTIFRCCCRAKNPKSNILSKIVNGVEARERDMIYEREVMDYVDRGLLDEDAYVAEQKLRRLEEERDEGSYYSEDEYTAQDRTLYTEDGDDSYENGVALEEGQAYSVGSRLTQSGAGWDEASESQY